MVWPTQGQQAPDFWDVQLKDYIDSRTGTVVETSAELRSALLVNNGDPILVRSGTYTTTKLTTTAPLDLRLDVGARIRLSNSQNDRLLTVIGSGKVSINGGVFDGNSTNNTVVDPSNQATLDITCDEFDIVAEVVNSPGTAFRAKADRGRGFLAWSEAKGHGVKLRDVTDVRMTIHGDGCDRVGVLVAPETQDCDRVEVSGVVRDVARSGSPHMGVYFNSGDTYIVKNSDDAIDVLGSGFVGKFPGGDYNRVGGLVDTTGTVTAAGAHGVWVHDSMGIELLPSLQVFRAARSGVLINKSHAIKGMGVRAELNGNAGINCTRDDTATGRYQGLATNKDVTLNGCHAHSNSQVGANVWAGFHIDGYQSVALVGCQAHDYQGVKTQARGLVAATNALTSNLVTIGNDWTGNLSGNGMSVADSYIAASYGNTPSDGTFVATGTAQLATDATIGFHYTPKIAGAPSGTPTARAGGWPTAYAASLGKAMIHDGTGWKSAPYRTRVFATTATLDFPSIPAASTAVLTVAVAGAVAGDLVTVTPNGAPEAGLVWCGSVTAAGVVTVRLANVTSGAIDPASRSYSVETRSVG